MAEARIAGPWRYPFALPKSAMESADVCATEFGWRSLRERFEDAGYVLEASGLLRNEDGVEPPIRQNVSADADEPLR